MVLWIQPLPVGVFKKLYLKLIRLLEKPLTFHFLLVNESFPVEFCVLNYCLVLFGSSIAELKN